jgi:ribose transport system substrate-binding protein
VAVTTVGLADVEEYGVQAAINSNVTHETWGRVLGAYAVLKHGADSNIVIYNVPELSFPPRVTKAAEEEIAALCPSCVVRVVEIPITSVGTDSPSRVVSDLQANPQSNIAIFPFYDVATGLPAALSTADITIDSIGLSPSPSNMQDIKNGGLTAGVSADLGVMFWTALDATARVALGEPLSEAEKIGIPPFTIIEAEDITFDPAGGYHAFPDFKEQFTTLWTSN